jgi:hypothetical protein
VHYRGTVASRASKRPMVGERVYDYEMKRDVYFGCIGLFWYIPENNTFIIYKDPLDTEMQKEDNINSSVITASDAHIFVWKSDYEQKYKLPYNHFPRGRVNYFPQNDRFELDMDGCLHTEQLINDLLNEYDLRDNYTDIVPPSENNKYSPNSRNEGHFSCYQCRR